MHGSTLWRLAKAGPGLLKTKQKEASLAGAKGEHCSVARDRAVIISLFFFRSVSEQYGGLAPMSAWEETVQLSCPVVPAAMVSVSSGKRGAGDSPPAALAFSPNSWG